MSLFRLLLIAGLSFCLVACKQQTRIAVVFSNVDELQVDNSVFHNGIEIGKVSDLSLYHDGVLATIQLNDKVRIPTGSTFRYEHALLGTPAIHVDYSNQQQYLSIADTSIGQYPKKLLDHLLSDSSKQEKIQQSIDKIGEGLSELAEAVKDSGTIKK
ncbi:MAG: MCE family protein [Niastella sp.]|nr:MCE family protein [Niastella sp.]